MPLFHDTVIPGAYSEDFSDIMKRYRLTEQRQLEDRHSWVISFDVTALNRGKFLDVPEQWSNSVQSWCWSHEVLSGCNPMTMVREAKAMRRFGRVASFHAASPCRLGIRSESAVGQDSV